MFTMRKPYINVLLNLLKAEKRRQYNKISIVLFLCHNQSVGYCRYKTHYRYQVPEVRQHFIDAENYKHFSFEMENVYTKIINGNLKYHKNSQGTFMRKCCWHEISISTRDVNRKELYNSLFWYRKSGNIKITFKARCHVISINECSIKSIDCPFVN